MKNLIFGAVFLLACMSMSALEITRYVSPIGTGDGMTPENPTADLGAMLELGAKVDQLYLYVNPGFYHLDFNTDAGGVTFKNIIIDGSWGDGGPSDVVHIDYPAVTFVNSILYKVSFAGSGTIQGGQMLNCVAEKGQLRAILGNGSCLFQHCKCKGFVAENWNYGSNNDWLSIIECEAKDGEYGLRGNHLNVLRVENSKFNCNSGGGVNIDGCKDAYFFDCTFNMNEGYGAVRLIEFDNAGTAMFARCEFEGNRVTYNQSYNINIHSNVSFYDCAFVNNYGKDMYSEGIVYLARPDFRFTNCTFIDNVGGGIRLESFYPSENQIVNCAFWNNNKRNIIYKGYADVPILNCAMDYCTGIPELDAQKGVITLTEANKGFSYNGLTVVIEPNSILINKGQPRSIADYDIQNHPRNALGGTDIGCAEFVSAPGLWQPDSLVLRIDDITYQLCKTTIDGIKYYVLLSELEAVTGAQIEFLSGNFIYLDTMPVAPKVIDGKYLERHLSDGNGGYIGDILRRDNDKYEWYVYDRMKYSSAKDRPTVKIVNDEVKFVMPTTTNKPATANKPTASKAGSAKKHPASKSQKSSQKSSKTNYWKR